MDVVAGTWGDPQRAELIRARLARGDSQEDCAARLRELGWKGASQTSVTRIETGAVRSPRSTSRAVLQAYVDEVPASSSTRSPTDDGQFDALYREISAEPLLGEIQRDVVKAGIAHIATLNQPMNVHDAGVWSDLTRILRLSE